MTTEVYRVLVIDDNPAIHEDFMKIIQGMQRKSLASDALAAKIFRDEAANESAAREVAVEMDTASQGEEGVEMIRKAVEENRPYSLAIVDMRMPPGWNGIETLREMWKWDGNIQTVICTAYSDHSWEDYRRELGDRPGLLILKKPVEPVVLMQAVSELSRRGSNKRKLREMLEILREQHHDTARKIEMATKLIDESSV
ncbi:MAG: response regulator [Myxococcota bacterium]